MLQALFFQSNQRIIQRDIKPENIFLREEGSVVLGALKFSGHSSKAKQWLAAQRKNTHYRIDQWRAIRVQCWHLVAWNGCLRNEQGGFPLRGHQRPFREHKPISTRHQHRNQESGHIGIPARNWKKTQPRELFSIRSNKYVPKKGTQTANERLDNGN